jgi:hypothetical protein
MKMNHVAQHHRHLTVGNAIGLPKEDALRIFVELCIDNDNTLSNVTPEHVANALDAYLAK